MTDRRLFVTALLAVLSQGSELSAQEPSGKPQAATPACVCRTLVAEGFASAMEKFHKMELDAHAGEFDRIAGEMRRTGRLDDAIRVHRLRASLLPDSAKAHAKLAAAFEANGQLLWARSSYTRAHRLDPSASNRTALWRIARKLAVARAPRGRRGQVLRVLDPSPGQDIADIGCGSGWLSETIAKRLDGKGTVYAIEIQKSKLRWVERKNIANIKPVHSRPNDITLPPDSIDIAMLHDVATHVALKVRPAFYKSIARALRPGGRLVVFLHHGQARRYLAEFKKFGFVPEDGEDLSGLAGRRLDRRLRQGVRFRYRPRRRT